jgi:hypothetical protein
VTPSTDLVGPLKAFRIPTEIALLSKAVGTIKQHQAQAPTDNWGEYA